MDVGGVPIIGQTREWQEFKFVFAPLAKRPLIDIPNKPPEIAAWQFGFMGIRSDGFPVQCLTVIDPVKLGDNLVQNLLRIVQITAGNFETFRTCNCLPGEPCALHTKEEVPGGRS